MRTVGRLLNSICQDYNDFMETKNTLGFKMPERSAAPAGSLLLKPKDAADWISSLPVANVGETSRQVFKALVEFNRLEVPNLNRIKIAELFRRPIDYISDNLRKYYYDSPFPLSAKSRKIAVLCRELHTELALAYKIFIETMVAGGSAKFDRKLLIIAVHRVMRLLSRVIYQSVIVYDPVPATVWKEIHRLYAFAEQNGIQKVPVRDGRNDDTISTIAALYKQALLLSICSPYRLRQREIECVSHALDDWSSHTTLRLPGAEPLSQFDFVARLSSDSPPLHHALENEEAADARRVLNTQPLVDMLRETCDTLPADDGAAEMGLTESRPSRHLLRRLIQILSSAPKREFVRTRLNFELKVAVGVTAIHCLLIGDGTAEEPVAAQRPGRGLEWMDQPAGDLLDRSSYTLAGHKLSLEGFDESIQETIIASSVNEPGSGKGGAPLWASRQSEQQHEAYSCKTINESAGGYCINWQGIDAPKIKIGEVIGVQSATNKRQFAIGISRWARNLSGQGLQLGLQMIAPSASAVLIHYLEGDDPASHPHKGLLLPELAASDQPACLILPTLPFKTGDLVMIVNEEGTERKARLTQLLETTGAFAQFHFSYPDAQAGNGDDLAGDDTDFDTIWPML
jgi:hypothetical protein